MFCFGRICMGIRLFQGKKNQTWFYKNKSKPIWIMKPVILASLNHKNMREWIMLIQQMLVLSFIDLRSLSRGASTSNMCSSKNNPIRCTLSNSTFSDINFITWLILIYISERWKVINYCSLQIKCYIWIFCIEIGTDLLLWWELFMYLKHLSKWTNPFPCSSCLLCLVYL